MVNRIYVIWSALVVSVIIALVPLKQLEATAPFTRGFRAFMGDATLSASPVLNTGWTLPTGGLFQHTGDSGFNSLRGVTIDKANGHLYVVDNGRDAVLKFELNTGNFIGAIGGLSLGSLGTCADSGTATGWCTGGRISGNWTDGSYGQPTEIANDGTSGYVLSSVRVARFDLATGAFTGAIGYVDTSTGTCVAGAAAAGWCTGGTFIGGTGLGAFTSASALAVDVPRNALYVVVNTQHRVDKFNLATGVYEGSIGRVSSSTGTCVAGGPASGWCTGGVFATGTAFGEFTNPLDVAVDTTNGFIFVSDRRGRVQRINASTGAAVGQIGRITTAGGTCTPVGAASGWCTGGVMNTGSTNGQYDFLTTGLDRGRLAVDVAGNALYIMDSNNNRLVRVNLTTGAFVGAVGDLTGSTGTCPSSGVSTTWCTGGTFTSAGTSDASFYGEYSTLDAGLEVDSAAGHIYTTTLRTVRRVQASTGVTLGALGARILLTTGWRPDEFKAPMSSGDRDGGFTLPLDVAVDGSSSFMYVLDSSRVARIHQGTGAFIDSIGEVQSTTGSCSVGVASAWCTGGTFVGATNGDGRFNNGGKLAVDTVNRHLYVSLISTASRVKKFNLDTGAFIGSIGRVTGSTGTCASPTASGWCTGGTFNSGALDGQFSDPMGMAIDATGGHLFVADRLNHRIVRVNLSTGAFSGAIGRTTATTGTCPASGVASSWCTGGTFASGAIDGAFNSPTDIAVDVAGGFLYVADRGNHRVTKHTLSTGAFIGAVGNTSSSTGTCPASGGVPNWCTGGTFASAPGDGAFNSPEAIDIDLVDNGLYIADRTNRRVVKYTLSSGGHIGSRGGTSNSVATCPAQGTATTWCTGGTFTLGHHVGRFTFPIGIAVDPTANLIYIVDTDAHRVQRFRK